MERLFDDKPYIVHRYLLPNVIELKPVPVDPRPDNFIDAEIIEFPVKEPDDAA